MRKLVMGVALAALSALAQDQMKHIQVQVQGAGEDGERVFVMQGPGPMPSIERMSLRPRTGAPYSAETTTETVQTLADGNRIVNKQTSRMYRDSEGRTRMENNFGPTGMWVPEGNDLSLTTIDDPVAGFHYMLNNKQKIATKMKTPKIIELKSAEGKAVQVEKDVFFTAADPAPAHAPGAGSGVGVGMGVASAGPAVMHWEAREGGPFHIMADNVQKESLGTQVIEGVQCEGTRETVVIPAGKIGNERELKSVTERWFSPELGFDLLRKHSDPRAGETTYRVTNLVRGEQPRTLFEPPADYRLDEAKGGTMMRDPMIKHKIESKAEVK